MGLTLVKWVGGKTQLLHEIRKRFPTDFGTDARDTYIEPFVGGGAVLFDVLSAYPEVAKVHANDLNRELVNAYVVARDETEALIDSLRRCADEYIPLIHEGRADVFYRWRNRFNDLIDTHSDDEFDENESVYGKDSVEQAALFLSLLKTCFNGLCRYNGTGHFNTPHGRYANPNIVDEDRIRSCAHALRNVTFHVGSYEQMGEYADAKTFILPIRHIGRFLGSHRSKHIRRAVSMTRTNANSPCSCGDAPIRARRSWSATRIRITAIQMTISSTSYTIGAA